MTDSLRVLTVGNRYPAPADAGGAACWPALVSALGNAGHEARVLTTTDPGATAPPPAPGVERSLQWFRAADGTWRRPARLEASRMGRHALLRLGETLQTFRPHVVVWTAMGGLPLTLVGASGLPELAIVHDDWPVYGPEVDPKARRDGWDPGAVACWSAATPALRSATLQALGDRVDPARVHVDRSEPATAWAAAILTRIGALAAAGPQQAAGP